MKSFILIIINLLLAIQGLKGQHYVPRIEWRNGIIKADPRLVVQSGYLLVPENRAHLHSRSIKIPFLFVRRPDQDAQKGISLFSVGGPGYSTTKNIDSFAYTSGWLRYGGFIAFDQRGTHRAIPSLDCPGVIKAVRRSYKEGLNRDSLVVREVNKCRLQLLNQGIDLNSYTTLESAEDINDLRKALHLDSLNLVGISYSGGLMLTVARLHPECVRTLVLNSPLPTNTNYEQDALLNINEALEQVFSDCATDSLNHELYGTLKDRFHTYFTQITGKKFSLFYKEKGHRDSTLIYYGKNELLDAVVNRLTTDQVSTVGGVIEDIIQGKQEPYVREVLDGYFSNDAQALATAMRYCVYCSEQIAYSDTSSEKKQSRLLPWLSGYRFNDVDAAICQCWKVKPEPPFVKTPVYSNVPALISAGDIDPWCRPFYNRLIQRSLPHSQLLLIHNRGHGAGFTVEGTDYLELFFKQPNKKIMSRSKDVVME